MADLRCSVENCGYNKDMLCSKGDINVGGKGACVPDDTCCESFREAREDAAIAKKLPVQPLKRNRKSIG